MHKMQSLFVVYFFLGHAAKQLCLVDVDIQFLHRPPPKCVGTSESPDPSVSRAVLAIATALPLGVILVIVTVALVFVLLYIWLVKRKRGRKTGADIERRDTVSITENTNANREAEPYG